MATKTERDERNEQAAEAIDLFYVAFVQAKNQKNDADTWLSRNERERGKDADAKAAMVLPMIHGGRDAALFKKLIGAYGWAKTKWLIAEFFHTTSPRVTRSQYQVIDLFNAAPSLVLGNHQMRDALTAHNIDAVRRAMGE